MTTWAEIQTGMAMNVVTADPTTCFAADWLAKNPPFSVVPDGTQPNAKTDGSGGWNNPDGSHVDKIGVFTPGPAPQKPVTTTKQQILDQITALQNLAAQLP